MTGAVLMADAVLVKSIAKRDMKSTPSVLTTKSQYILFGKSNQDRDVVISLGEYA